MLRLKVVVRVAVVLVRFLVLRIKAGLAELLIRDTEVEMDTAKVLVAEVAVPPKSATQMVRGTVVMGFRRPLRGHLLFVLVVAVAVANCLRIA
jgi:predicted metal-binding transcription factor (methanogenesis marker protein 9)